MVTDLERELQELYDLERERPELYDLGRDDAYAHARERATLSQASAKALEQGFSPVREGATEDEPQPQTLADAFALYDTNGDGMLDRTEVAAMVEHLGYDVDADYVGGVIQMFGTYDLNADGAIESDQFGALWERLGEDPLPAGDSADTPQLPPPAEPLHQPPLPPPPPPPPAGEPVTGEGGGVNIDDIHADREYTDEALAPPPPLPPPLPSLPDANAIRREEYAFSYGQYQRVDERFQRETQLARQLIERGPQRMGAPSVADRVGVHSVVATSHHNLEVAKRQLSQGDHGLAREALDTAILTALSNAPSKQRFDAQRFPVPHSGADFDRAGAAAEPELVQPPKITLRHWKALREYRVAMALFTEVVSLEHAPPKHFDAATVADVMTGLCMALGGWCVAAQCLELRHRTSYVLLATKIQVGLGSVGLAGSQLAWLRRQPERLGWFEPAQQLKQVRALVAQLREIEIQLGLVHKSTTPRPPSRVSGSKPGRSMKVNQETKVTTSSAAPSSVFDRVAGRIPRKQKPPELPLAHVRGAGAASVLEFINAPPSLPAESKTGLGLAERVRGGGMVDVIDFANLPLAPPPPGARNIGPPPGLSSANGDERGTFLDAFDRYDTNNDGVLDSFEIAAMIDDLGYEIVNGNYAPLFAKFDLDKNGTIEIDEFQDLWEHLRGNVYPKIPPSRANTDPQAGTARAIADCVAIHSDELSFKRGEIVEVLGGAENDAAYLRGHTAVNPSFVGLFPANFVSFSANQSEKVPAQQPSFQGTHSFGLQADGSRGRPPPLKMPNAESQPRARALPLALEMPSAEPQPEATAEDSSQTASSFRDPVLGTTEPTHMESLTDATPRARAGMATMAAADVLREQREEILQLFRQMDEDGNGYLDAPEIAKVSEVLGMDIAHIYSEFDADHDGRISLDEFSDVYGKVHPPSELVFALGKAVEVLEEFGESELLVILRLRAVMGLMYEKLGEHVQAKNHARVAVAQATELQDDNHDGVVSPQEFRTFKQEEASHLLALGLVFTGNGEYRRALKCGQMAASCHHTLGAQIDPVLMESNRGQTRNDGGVQLQDYHVEEKHPTPRLRKTAAHGPSDGGRRGAGSVALSHAHRTPLYAQLRANAFGGEMHGTGAGAGGSYGVSAAALHHKAWRFDEDRIPDAFALSRGERTSTFRHLPTTRMTGSSLHAATFEPAGNRLHV